MVNNLITREEFICLVNKEKRLRQQGQLLSTENIIKYKQYIAYMSQLEQQFFFPA